MVNEWPAVGVSRLTTRHLAAALCVPRSDLGEQAAIVEAQDQDMALDQFRVEKRFPLRRRAEIVPGVVVEGGGGGRRAQGLQHLGARGGAGGDLLDRLLRHHIAAVVDGGRAAGRGEAERDKHGGNPYHGDAFPLRSSAS